jgi:hypothetical protein
LGKIQASSPLLSPHRPLQRCPDETLIGHAFGFGFGFAAHGLQDGCSVLSEGLLLGSEATMGVRNEVKFAESDITD